MINAKLEASTNGSRSVRCELGIQFAPGPFALRDHTRTDVKGEVKVAGVALQDTATVAQGVFYEVRCRRSVAGTDDVFVDATKLTAIQVGSINP